MKEDLFHKIFWPLLAILISVGIGLMKQQFGIGSIIISVVILLVLILVNSFFLRSSYNKELKNFNKDLSKIVISFHRIIESFKEKYPWIISCDEVKEIEKNADEIWIYTPDLRHDLTNFYDIIKENLRKGKIYKYVLPNNPKVVGNFKTLKKIYLIE
ncbi:hypothetical protein DRQ20_05585 [bacterium]|nr:MAG: hypothetical protein DRQ20_05585 [bacterium]